MVTSSVPRAKLRLCEDKLQLLRECNCLGDALSMVKQYFRDDDLGIRPRNGADHDSTRAELLSSCFDVGIRRGG